MSVALAAQTDFLKTQLKEGVLTITLNRPDALNAFRPEMLIDIERLLLAADQNDNVAVIILEGEGRAFSAGVDLKVLQGTEPKAGKIGDTFDKPARRAYEAIRDVSQPVIAKVHGACFTGALEIALHCDFIYTTVDTKFGDTHAKFGLRPTWGMSQTLSQAVGVRRAKELSFSARTFKGTDAVAWGLALEAVENKEALDALVAERAKQISGNSPAAVSAFKDLYRISQSGRDINDALREELAQEYVNISDTKERLAGF